MMREHDTSGQDMREQDMTGQEMTAKRKVNGPSVEQVLPNSSQ
jgi:hypothetical protein